MRKVKLAGFTMVELLVVLVIVAILAAVATPLYIANTRRAKASEAVATMGLIRQALRDFRVNNNTYFDIPVLATTGNIQNPLPPLGAINLGSGLVTPANTYGVDVDTGIPQYFSNAAFSVQAAGTGALPDVDGASNLLTNPPAQDFIITVAGSGSIGCSTSVVANCAVKAGDINNGASAYVLEMDNTGRVAISYDNGTKWSSY